jgi:acyl-coenzyme A synthetase/AMP-(fatty) acid ligase
MLSLDQLGTIVDVRSGTAWGPAELQRQIALRRHAIESAGVGRGDRVVIAHGGTPGFFADLFAAWSLGACCACINPALTRGELETVVDFATPRALLVADDDACPVEGLGVAVVDTASNGAMADVPLGLPLQASDPALILFTSGTTGNPKGVVHSAASLSARIDCNRRYIGDAVLQRTLCVLPTHFGHGLIGNCLTPLLSGAHLYLYPSPGIQGLPRFGGILGDNRITFMSSVPAFWKLVTKMARPPVEHALQQINIGSAPLSAELWRAVIAWSGVENVNNMYGITETANWAAGASALVYPPEDGLVGTMWGGEFAVLGEDGARRAQGEGEVLLRTPSLMSGYYQRPDLTAEVVRDGWYYTGDQGCIDANGVLRLLGRLKTEINKAGTKILPEEVDLLLERHPQVAEACTFGMPDPINGERVAVAVHLADVRLTATMLKQWCAERIRTDCVPEKWFIVPEIPKTDRGKINRSRVRDVCLAGGA